MRKLVPIMLIAAMAVGGIYLAFVRAHREPGITGPVLSVRFLDESLGNAVVLKTPEGDRFVIDPPSGRRAEALGKMLQDKRGKEITVMISNPSSESIRALEKLRRFVRVARIVRPDLGTANESWEMRLAKLSGTPILETVAARGNRIRLSPTVALHVLGPDRETARGGDHGWLVFRLIYGAKSFLFPGEIRADGEAELIKSGQDLTSNVLMVGRRGQYGSTSLELLSLVRPEIVVISAKRGANRPAPSVLDRLSAANTGAALYRTDKDGVIKIDTDGRSFQVQTGGGGP